MEAELREAVRIVDDLFGRGYSRMYPELPSAILLASALDRLEGRSISKPEKEQDENG
jgi:hypothetical protein